MTSGCGGVSPITPAALAAAATSQQLRELLSAWGVSLEEREMDLTSRAASLEASRRSLKAAQLVLDREQEDCRVASLAVAAREAQCARDEAGLEGQLRKLEAAATALSDRESSVEEEWNRRCRSDTARLLDSRKVWESAAEVRWEEERRALEGRSREAEARERLSREELAGALERCEKLAVECMEATKQRASLDRRVETLEREKLHYVSEGVRLAGELESLREEHHSALRACAVAESRVESSSKRGEEAAAAAASLAVRLEQSQAACGAAGEEKRGLEERLALLSVQLESTKDSLRACQEEFAAACRRESGLQSQLAAVGGKASEVDAMLALKSRVERGAEEACELERSLRERHRSLSERESLLREREGVVKAREGGLEVEGERLGGESVRLSALAGKCSERERSLDERERASKEREDCMVSTLENAAKLGDKLREGLAGLHAKEVGVGKAVKRLAGFTRSMSVFVSLLGSLDLVATMESLLKGTKSRERRDLLELWPPSSLDSTLSSFSHDISPSDTPFPRGRRGGSDVEEMGTHHPKPMHFQRANWEGPGAGCSARNLKRPPKRAKTPPSFRSSNERAPERREKMEEDALSPSFLLSPDQPSPRSHFSSSEEDCQETELLARIWPELQHVPHTGTAPGPPRSSRHHALSRRAQRLLRHSAALAASSLPREETHLEALQASLNTLRPALLSAIRGFITNATSLKTALTSSATELTSQSALLASREESLREEQGRISREGASLSAREDEDKERFSLLRAQTVAIEARERRLVEREGAAMGVLSREAIVAGEEAAVAERTLACIRGEERLAVLRREYEASVSALEVRTKSLEKKEAELDDAVVRWHKAQEELTAREWEVESQKGALAREAARLKAGEEALARQAKEHAESVEKWLGEVANKAFEWTKEGERLREMEVRLAASSASHSTAVAAWNVEVQVRETAAAAALAEATKFHRDAEHEWREALQSAAQRESDVRVQAAALESESATLAAFRDRVRELEEHLVKRGASLEKREESIEAAERELLESRARLGAELETMKTNALQALGESTRALEKGWAELEAEKVSLGEREQALQRREEEVSEGRALLATELASAAYERDRLEGEKKRVWERAGEVELGENQVRTWEASVRERENGVESREAGVRQREELLTTGEEGLREAQARLDTSRLTLDSMEESLREVKMTLEGARQDLEARNAACAEREAGLVAKERYYNQATAASKSAERLARAREEEARAALDDCRIRALEVTSTQKAAESELLSARERAIHIVRSAEEEAADIKLTAVALGDSEGKTVLHSAQEKAAAIVEEAKERVKVEAEQLEERRVALDKHASVLSSQESSQRKSGWALDKREATLSNRENFLIAQEDSLRELVASGEKARLEMDAWERGGKKEMEALSSRLASEETRLKQWHEKIVGEERAVEEGAARLLKGWQELSKMAALGRVDSSGSSAEGL